MKNFNKKYLALILVAIVVVAAVVIVVMKPAEGETMASLPIIPTGSSASY